MSVSAIAVSTRGKCILLILVILLTGMAGCRARTRIAPSASAPTGTAVVAQSAGEASARGGATRTPTPQVTSPPHAKRVDGVELTVTTMTVARHGIDLPTFLEAVAAEIRTDPRFRVTSFYVDGTLRTDGVPVGVISFGALGIGDSPPTAGRQYAIALPHGQAFLTVTCATVSVGEADKCDETVRTMELTAEPATR